MTYFSLGQNHIFFHFEPQICLPPHLNWHLICKVEPFLVKVPANLPISIAFFFSFSCTLKFYWKKVFNGVNFSTQKHKASNKFQWTFSLPHWRYDLAIQDLRQHLSSLNSLYHKVMSTAHLNNDYQYFFFCFFPFFNRT